MWHLQCFIREMSKKCLSIELMIIIKKQTLPKPQKTSSDRSLPTYHPRTVTIFSVYIPNQQAIWDRPAFCHAQRLPKHRIFIHEWVISPLVCEPPSASFTATDTLHGHCDSEFTLSQYITSPHAPTSKTENKNQLVSSFFEIILFKATDYCGTSSQGWLYSFPHEKITLTIQTNVQSHIW